MKLEIRLCTIDVVVDDSEWEVEILVEFSVSILFISHGKNSLFWLFRALDFIYFVQIVLSSLTLCFKLVLGLGC